MHPFVLVTGATGYVGGRLVPRLLDAGYRVRILTRDSDRLTGREWRDSVEIVVGDFSSVEKLLPALAGIDVAYYLIRGREQCEKDCEDSLVLARNFAQAASLSEIQRIIYLGKLRPSPIESATTNRICVGDVLRQSGISVTELQATVIMGGGSAAFEIVRYLTERLPILAFPPWAYTAIQPISITDALDYLIAALESPNSAGKTVEIGGPERLSFAEMVHGYALVRDLRRWSFRTPWFPRILAASGIHWLTPVSTDLAMEILDCLGQDIVIHDEVSKELFPEVDPLIYHITLQRAIDRMNQGQVETSWRDALWRTTNGDRAPAQLVNREGLIFERVQLMTTASAEAVFRVFCSLGGEGGWMYLNVAWRLRGWLDRFIGGVGIRRGRRDPTDLRVGDAVDFWRVESLIPNSLLRFRSEMKLPGEAWLELETRPLSSGKTGLTLTAIFAPRGLWGFLYWYLLYPIHKMIFQGTLSKIRLKAEAG